MIFGRVPLIQAQGGILAHSLRVADRVLRKGILLDTKDLALLHAAGYEEVTIARLEPGDMPESEAVVHLGENLLGPGIRRSQDVHGRVNLFAEFRGLLRLDVAAIERLNLIDEAVTLATLPDRSVVDIGDLVATLKIIPFAVSAPTISAAETLLRQEGRLLTVKPFLGLSTGLILTKLPQLKDTAIASTVEVTRARIAANGGTMLPPCETPHEIPPLVAAIKGLLAQGADILLISGASAVTDRLDVVPQAIVAAGGRITRFGMPVDPGNLICFGSIGTTPVVVLPGCARSPRLNGIDWMLNRLFAGEAVDSQHVAAMGVGGLLQEIETRPLPRDPKALVGFDDSNVNF